MTIAFAEVEVVFGLFVFVLFRFCVSEENLFGSAVFTYIICFYTSNGTPAFTRRRAEYDYGNDGEYVKYSVFHY